MLSKKMMALSAFFGVFSALLGLVLSYHLDTASGATIVLTATGVSYSINAIPFNATLPWGLPTDSNLNGHRDFDGIEYEGVAGKITFDVEGDPIKTAAINQVIGGAIDFVKFVDPHRFEIRTYERGVEAETLACGTGACAAVVSGINLGLIESPVEVKLRGGKLDIEWSGEGTPVFMTGPAEYVYEGSYEMEKS